MFSKLKHYINRYRYNRSHRILPEIAGGTGACGQDILIHNLLNKKQTGNFVDIGANDGVTLSNTLYFEKTLGWRGIAIEPIPSVFEKLKNNRSCQVINGCICPTAGKAKFLEVVGEPNMLSTLAIYNVGLTKRRLKKNAQRHNAEIREIDVECYTPNSLFAEYGIAEIDFLSVDTEGGELEILQSIDFDQTTVKVISVENNYFTGAVKKYLEKSGFIYIGTFEVNEIYVFGGDELRRVMKQLA